MKKLFVSFTSLLKHVSAGLVTAEDLAQGLFFFGCWREHALEPGAAGEFDERSLNPLYPATHEVIKAALLQAETEGRVEWHNDRKRTGSPWRRLDDLLSANGLRILKARPANTHASYAYPAVRDAVDAAGLPLEVVF